MGLKEIFFTLLSIGLICWYSMAFFITGANLFFNRDVITDHIKATLMAYLIGASFALVAGSDWLIHSDFMKVAGWQALFWGITHISLPYGIYRLNLDICEKAKLNCQEIRSGILSYHKSLAKVS